MSKLPDSDVLILTVQAYLEAGSGADMVHPSAAAAGNIPPGMSRAAVQESRRTRFRMPVQLYVRIPACNTPTHK